MVAATTKKYYTYKPTPSQSFGAFRTQSRRHRGTDFAHGYGTLVPALISGKVIGKLVPAAWHGFGFQITVEGKGPDGRLYRVSYSHAPRGQSTPLGASVKQGTYISTEGTTGATSGACCHVEVFDVAKGVYIDPMILVKKVLTAKPASAGSATNPSPSNSVKTIQRKLNKLRYGLKVDGIKGPKTVAAIKGLQRKYGLTADGIWGPKTEALYKRLTTEKRPVLRFGSRGENVRRVQRKLGIKADGIYGSSTKAAVKAFQRKHGLVADGVVGPKTWAKLGI